MNIFSRKGSTIILEIMIALFVILFLYTATSKYLDFSRFHFIIHRLPLLKQASKVVAYGIPFLEIVISFMLISRRYRQIGLWSFTILMILFTFFIGAILLKFFGGGYPCSCGGVISNMSWQQHLLFNIGFVIAGIFSILIYRNQRK